MGFDSRRLAIDGTTILQKTELGASVKTSSLKQVGTLGSLTVLGKLTALGDITHSSVDDFEIISKNNIVVVEAVNFDAGRVTKVVSINATGNIVFSASTESDNSTTGALVVSGGVGVGKALNALGTIFTNGNEVAVTSDLRYKKNIRPIQNASILLRKLRGVTYYYRAEEYSREGFPMEEQVGVIAQEIKSVLPQAIFTRDDGFQYVSYASLNALLLEGFKENIAKLNFLFQHSNRASYEILWIPNLIYGNMPIMGIQEECIEKDNHARKLQDRTQWTGSLKAIVILLKTTDFGTPPRENFEILFNGDGTDKDYAPTGSVKEYFKQNSYGQLDDILETEQGVEGFFDYHDEWEDDDIEDDDVKDKDAHAMQAV